MPSLEDEPLLPPSKGVGGIPESPLEGLLDSKDRTILNHFRARAIPPCAAGSRDKYCPRGSADHVTAPA